MLSQIAEAVCFCSVPWQRGEEVCYRSVLTFGGVLSAVCYGSVLCQCVDGVCYGSVLTAEEISYRCVLWQCGFKK